MSACAWIRNRDRTVVMRRLVDFHDRRPAGRLRGFGRYAAVASMKVRRVKSAVVLVSDLPEQV